MTKALSINLDDKGQNFASVATVRAALFDILDSDEWFFEKNVLTEDEQNEERTEFVNRVITRIAELQVSCFYSPEINP